MANKEASQRGDVQEITIVVFDCVSKKKPFRGKAFKILFAKIIF
jgi:hypothetical protein